MGYSYPKGHVPWNKGTKGLMVTPHNKVEIPKEKLIEYIKQGLNSKKIGEHFGVLDGAILRRIHDYGIYEMYEEHAVRWESLSIEEEGLTCTGCGFNCKFEDRKENFYVRNGGRKPLMRGSYSSKCKPCSAIDTKKSRVKRHLAENPDWKPQVIAFYDETDAECTTCRKIQPHADFPKAGVRSSRPVAASCKACTSDIGFEKRRKDIKLNKYKHYKSIMRSEDNDCDLTYEEFLEYWPKDNKCPILGHEFKLFPREERGKWTGGRHYPYTPTIDHIDPRQDLSKDNMWVICWRANEIKSDMIIPEMHLLSKAMIRKKGGLVNNFYLEEKEHHRQLKESGWIGKYSNRT